MTTINTAIATMFEMKGVKVKVKPFCTSQRSLENHNCVPFIGKVGKIVGILDGHEDECGKYAVKFEGEERNWNFYGDLLKIVDETITIRKDLTSLSPELQEQLQRVEVKIKPFDYYVREFEVQSMQRHIGSVGKIEGFFQESTKACFSVFGWNWEGDLLEVKTKGLKSVLKGSEPKAKPAVDVAEVVKAAEEITVGTRVELVNINDTVHGGTYYKSSSNEVGNTGKVTECDAGGAGWFRVKWDNGSSNTYRKENLKVLGEVKVSAPVEVVAGFAIGDRVELINITDFVNGGVFSTYDKSNVVGNKGEVIGSGISGEAGWIRVKWDNGTCNSYRSGNLKVISEVAGKPVDKGIKVGDYIRGNSEGNNYGMTNKDAIMRVVRVKGSQIDVVVLAHKGGKYIGHNFSNVLTHKFHKITEADKVEFDFTPEEELAPSTEVVEKETFKVGDIVTGIPFNGYAITTSRAIMKVVALMEDHMRVELLAHSCVNWQHRVGNDYHVEQKGFKKFKEGVDFSTLTK